MRILEIILLSCIILFSNAKIVRVVELIAEDLNPEATLNKTSSRNIDIDKHYALGGQLNSVLIGEDADDPNLKVSNLIILNTHNFDSLLRSVAFVSGFINDDVYISKEDLESFNETTISKASSDEDVYSFRLSEDSEANAIVKLLNQSLLLEANNFQCGTRRTILDYLKSQYTGDKYNISGFANQSCGAFLNEIVGELRTRNTEQEYTLSTVYQIMREWIINGEDELKKHKITEEEGKNIKKCLASYIDDLYFQDEDVIRLNAGYLLYTLHRELTPGKNTAANKDANVFVFYTNRVVLESVLMALYSEAMSQHINTTETLDKESVLTELFGVDTLLFTLEEIKNEHFITIQSPTLEQVNFSVSAKNFGSALSPYNIRTYDDYNYFCQKHVRTDTHVQSKLEISIIVFNYTILLGLSLVGLLCICVVLFKKQKQQQARNEMLELQRTVKGSSIEFIDEDDKLQATTYI
jgi:hypothetical protein